MQALILAGGEGTRLRPLTLNTPKPIVPIANQPFLVRQIQSLKSAGIDDVILSLNYQPSAIEKILGDGTEFGVRLRYLIEPAPLGTAGAYKFAEKLLHTSTLVLNGDILTDINLQTVADRHKKTKAAATIVLKKVENPAAYGLVETTEDNKVVRFMEKPNAEEISRLNINTINAGIYILEPRVLDYIPENEKCSFEYQLFPNLLKNHERFFAYNAGDDYWLDIGTPQRYWQANDDLINNRLKNFAADRNADFEIAASAEIGATACLANACRIDAKTRIINSVLGENVIVGENAVIENSVIWAGTKAESGVKISNSLVGSDCLIKKNTVVENAVLADQTIFSN